MDSGPVATFQVHEYLRPKVRLPLPLLDKNLTINFCYFSVFKLILIFLNITSSVIYMKMTQSSISLSAV